MKLRLHPFDVLFKRLIDAPVATVQKRQNGNYYAYFYEKHREPQRKSYPLRVQLKSTAIKKLKKLEKAYVEGRFDPWRDDPWIEKPDAEPISVKKAISEYLTDKQGEIRATTVDTYRQQLGAWRKALPIGLNVADVQGKHIAEYVRAGGIKNATQRKRYRHLQAFLNWCREKGYLDTNPIDGVQKPRRENRETPVLTREDINTLIDVINEHARNTEDSVGRSPDVQWLKDAIVIAAYTGLRRSELGSLRWKDIDLKQRTLSVRNREGEPTKTGDERTVPLQGPALRRLLAIRRRQTERVGRPKGTSHVIADQKGDAVRLNRITKRFKFFVREAELDDRFHFHSLRHSCASMLAAKGVSLQIIQKILGHSTVTTTERYSHLQLEVMADAMKDAFGED